jgi:hypothetical protein
MGVQFSENADAAPAGACLSASAMRPCPAILVAFVLVDRRIGVRPEDRPYRRILWQLVGKGRLSVCRLSFRIDRSLSGSVCGRSGRRGALAALLAARALEATVPDAKAIRPYMTDAEKVLRVIDQVC